MRRILSLLGLTLMGLVLLAAPASANMACVAGNFSNIGGTTCDIGSLQFTFGNIQGGSYSWDANTHSYIYNIAWGNSDFEFTPLSNGFTFTFLGGPQSVTAPANGQAGADADLRYFITDLNLNEWVDCVSVSGGGYSTSNGGYGGYGDYGGLLPCTLFQSWHTAYDEALIFSLGGQNGASMSWDGTPTTFTYDTSSVIHIPEPCSVLLVSIALALLVPFVRRKVREGF